MSNCLACKTPLKGRSDKKFCDYNCRNAYHNFLNQPSKNYLSKINRQLGKNHRILAELHQAGVALAPLCVLEAMGFNADLHTAQFRDEAEGVVSFIYDIAYQQNGSELVLLAKELETYRQSA